MMKKIIILFVCLMFVFGAGFAENSLIDLKDMSDEEVYLFFNSAKDELANRAQFNSDTLWPGDYIVGKDVEAGRYSFSCIEIASPDRTEGYIEMNSSIDDSRNIGYAKFFGNNSFDVGEEQRVELCDGEVLFIRYAIFLPIKIG